MNLVPQYNYPVGTEVTLFSQKMVLSSKTDEGYEWMDVETGEVGVTSFSKFVELMKSPAMRVENSRALKTDVVSLRLGGLKVAEQLPRSQQEYGKFHHAICMGAVALRSKLREERCQPNLHLTGPLLNDSENRKFICSVAGEILGKRVHPTNSRGGNSREWVLYAGRTILKYLALFDDLESTDDVNAALATRDHLKGNKTRRISYRLMELMTQAWEEIGLDQKATSVANVHRYLETLVHEENKKRTPNELKRLIVPSHKTLRTHRDFLLSPTEYLVATKGKRHAKNKRGRGSSDIRALLPGEMVEADECKLSLISSAKERGYWENLSATDRKTLEEIDAEIKKRLTLLVLIDVATRMPLAWVVSDQPKAEATLALLRMATRDKTKEKIKYGCSGNPAPEMGLGSVKTDNGVGLRNKPVLQSLLGIETSYTAVRTYASDDKPYIERLIGTTESVLIKLIHGYTGRKAGELPGYDANENGVLDIDELNGILTRFFIDEYPSMRHMGVGMGGRRPAEVIKELNQTRGLFRPINEDQRRIHLGWKAEVTPNDEGVRVFSGLWFNSQEFQIAIDDKPATKVSVFIDPDNLNEATAIIPGVADEFRLQLQITAYADMTIPEVLEVTQAYRREHPEVTEIHEDRIAETRRARHDQLCKIGVERNLARSYSTHAECKAMARHLFGDISISKSTVTLQTVHPGEINSLSNGPGVVQIGQDKAANEADNSHLNPEEPHGNLVEATNKKTLDDATHSAATQNSETNSDDDKHKPIGRPKNKGTFK